MVLFFGLENTNRTFLPTFKALNMLDGTSFVVFLVVNMLFLLFWGILSLNCISSAYLVTVYTVNTPTTPYCLSLTAENVPLTFGVVLRSSKHQPYHCSYFQALNMLHGILFVFFQLLNMLFLLFWGILTLNCISRKYLVAVYTVNTPR